MAQKAQLGLPNSGAYFRCSRHAAVPRAGLSVVVPLLLALVGWMVALLQVVVNTRWPENRPVPLPTRRHVPAEYHEAATPDSIRQG